VTRVSLSITLALAGVLLAPRLPAQQLIRNYGEERAATTVLPFLKIGVGARAEGMAQAFVGVADDVSALYWNPGGLGRMEGGAVSFSHLEWPAEISYDYLGVVQRLGKRLSVGLAYAQLKTDEMAVTTETHPQGNGRTFYFIDQSVQATGCLRMTDQFSVGLSLKYVREDLDDVSMAGFLGDIGTYYRTGWRDLSVAVSLSNFGGQFRPEGSHVPPGSADGRAVEYDEASPPTLFRIGSAVTVLERDDHRLLCSGQINHPVDNAENYLLGLEYGWMERFFARGGWKFNAGEESWTLGAGLDFKLNGLGVVLDLSYSDFGILSESKRTSAEFNWGWQP
jgi:hypothetical protein